MLWQKIWALEEQLPALIMRNIWKRSVITSYSIHYTKLYEKALAKLLPYQRSDFEGIFQAMAGYGVTVRLLDPPLHEFVPHNKAAQEDLAKEMGISLNQLLSKIEDLEEFNPMLGHRGCRLGITYPEITAMQARAIIEAALNLKAKGIDAKPEIMVPLVGTIAELKNQSAVIRDRITSYNVCYMKLLRILML